MGNMAAKSGKAGKRTTTPLLPFDSCLLPFDFPPRAAGPLAYAPVAFSVLLWGLSFPAGASLAGHLSPWWLTAWRYTLAAAVVNALAFASLGRAALLPARVVPRVALMGLLGHALFSVCFFAGLQSTPTATAAVISGLEPAITVALAAVLQGARAGARVWGGVAGSFAGAALLAGAAPAHGLAAHAWSGPLLMFASAASFAVYSLMCANSALGMAPLGLTAATMRWSLPPLWLALVFANGACRPPAPADWAGLAFFVLGVTVCAFLGWNKSLRTLGLSRTVVWGNLVPAVGVIAAVLSGETVLPAQWCGLALVAGGVWVAQGR